MSIRFNQEQGRRFEIEPQEILRFVKGLLVSSGFVHQRLLDESEQKLPIRLVTHESSDPITEFASPNGSFSIYEDEGGRRIGIISIKKSLLNPNFYAEARSTILEEYLHYLQIANNSFLQDELIQNLKRRKEVEILRERGNSDIEVRHILGLEDDISKVLDQHIQVLNEVNGSETDSARLRESIVIASFSNENITIEESLEIARELADKLTGDGKWYEFLNTGSQTSLKERLAFIQTGNHENNDLSKRYESSIHYGLIQDIKDSVRQGRIDITDLESILERRRITRATLSGKKEYLTNGYFDLNKQKKLEYLRRLAMISDVDNVRVSTEELKELTRLEDQTSSDQTDEELDPIQRLIQITNQVEQGKRIHIEIISPSSSNRDPIDRVLNTVIHNLIQRQIRNAGIRSLILEAALVVRMRDDVDEAIRILSNQNRREEFIQSVINDRGDFLPEGIKFSDFMTREGWERVRDILSNKFETLKDEDITLVEYLLRRTWNESFGVSSGSGDLLRRVQEIHRKRRLNSSTSLNSSYKMRAAEISEKLSIIKINLLCEPIAKIIRHKIRTDSMPSLEEFMESLRGYEGFTALTSGNYDPTDRQRPRWTLLIRHFVAYLLIIPEIQRLINFYSYSSFQDQTNFLYEEFFRNTI